MPYEHVVPRHTQILENNTLKKLGKTRVDEITLVEHRRAHNISIELSGIKLGFQDIKVRRGFHGQAVHAASLSSSINCTGTIDAAGR